MKYEVKPVLSGGEIGRTRRCRHGAKQHEHCSDCDVGKLHVINLTDEELDVILRALTFAADFQADYYTLHPGDDYNSGYARKQDRGERILVNLRATLGNSPKHSDKMKTLKSEQRRHLIVNAPCHLFTPRLTTTGKRLALRLSDAD